jgi:hypothetical protein
MFCGSLQESNVTGIMVEEQAEQVSSKFALPKLL